MKRESGNPASEDIEMRIAANIEYDKKYGTDYGPYYGLDEEE
jgi:hypothetical protein